MCNNYLLPSNELYSNLNTIYYDINIDCKTFNLLKMLEKSQENGKVRYREEPRYHPEQHQ